MVKKATKSTKSAKKTAKARTAKKSKKAKSRKVKAPAKKAKRSTKKSAATTAKKSKKASKSTKSAKKPKKATAAAKTPAKKAKSRKATTKAATPRSAEQPVTLHIYDMQNTPEHEHFYFVNGHRVKNVKELAEVMDRIEHEVFDYHVNEHRNDFYNWVSNVFKDIELAEKLLGVTGPKHLQFTIYKHVADHALKRKRG